MDEDPERLLLNVVRAARRMVSGTFREYASNDLISAVDALNAALEPPTPATWGRMYWGQVKAGDRVRLPAGDGYSEADVESASDLKWIGSGTHQVKIKLAGRDQIYTMPASGVVEVAVQEPLLDIPSAEALRILRQSFPGVTHIGEVKS